MQNSPKYLIDTNVFIGLEDPGLTSPQLAALVAIAARHSVPILVHEAALDDLSRDRDCVRRAASLSKLAKFQMLSKVRRLTREVLATEFGRLAKPNDVVDATLLHALRLGAVDFLISQDHGLHERAARHSTQLAERVLYVSDALALLRATYEPLDVPLRFVEEVDAHAIPLEDPIFDSLRDDYQDFDEWWRHKCIRGMRKCWIVADEGRLAGLIVRKDEDFTSTDATLSGRKFLKVCTFKVSPESRGIKLGELLLRKVLWFGQANRYDAVYLTTFGNQQTLIDLLDYYGFTNTYTKTDGELVYEKGLRGPVISSAEDLACLFDTNRRAYPKFYAGREAPLLGVPIKEEFHSILFPDIDEPVQYSLFGAGPRRAGNTIRKVYLSRTKKSRIEPGSVLLFYKGKSGMGISQAVTSVGIAESLSLAGDTDELRRLAGGRSVYSERQLRAFHASAENPVKVINFLLVGHLERPICLDELRELGFFKGHPAQSIFSVGEGPRGGILERLALPLQAN